VLHRLRGQRSPHPKRPDTRVGELHAFVWILRRAIRVADNHRAAAAPARPDDGPSIVDAMSESDEVSNMPLPQFAATRTDSNHIGTHIKQLVDLMLDGMTWRKAADHLGISRRVAERALQKPHVRAYARNKKIQTIEELAMTVPVRLHELMLQDRNPNASVRAATALHDMANTELASRRLGGLGTPTPGLTIQIVTEGPKPLTINNSVIQKPAPPVNIDHAPHRLERTADE
jgi:hypothetical protein